MSIQVFACELDVLELSKVGDVEVIVGALNTNRRLAGTACQVDTVFVEGCCVAEPTKITVERLVIEASVVHGRVSVFQKWNLGAEVDVLTRKLGVDLV